MVFLRSNVNANVTLANAPNRLEIRNEQGAIAETGGLLHSAYKCPSSIVPRTIGNGIKATLGTISVKLNTLVGYYYESASGWYCESEGSFNQIGIGNKLHRNESCVGISPNRS
jgi:hypothetical protein